MWKELYHSNIIQGSKSSLFFKKKLIKLTTSRKTDKEKKSEDINYQYQEWNRISFFFKDFIYLLLERGEGGRKRGRETSNGCFSHALIGGPGPQPRHVPWLGIELVTFRFASCYSIHWATPARAWNGISL